MADAKSSGAADDEELDEDRILSEHSSVRSDNVN